MPDWRDSDAYEPLLGADRSLIAWEWLRRDPGYRAAVERALGAGGSGDRGDPAEAPERWGLHAFEPPDRTAPHAKPIWCAEVHPHVLGVDADLPEGEDLFDLKRVGAISTLVTGGDGREHLLISDGLRAIRVDVLAGTLARGPVQLRYRLAGLAAVESALRTLERLLSLWRTGRFVGPLHPREARAKRWQLMLRARDAVADGANQRAIAAQLLGGDPAQHRWRVETPSLRSQVQRLVRGAEQMAQGGYQELLR